MADIQPDIALGIRPPAPPPSMSDTIGMAANLGKFQQSINANQAFQQEQQARSAAGTLIASGLSGDALISAMQKNRDIGAYLPQLMQEQANIQNTLLSNQGQDLSNRKNVAAGMLQALTPALANPSQNQIDTIQSAYQSGLPDDLKKKTQEGLDNLKHSLTYGLDLSKPEDGEKLRGRMVGALQAAGVTPDAIVGQIGAAGLHDGLSVIQKPVWQGGQTVLAGSGQGSGAAPNAPSPPPSATSQTPVPIVVPPPGPDGKLPAGWGVPDGAPKGTPPTRIAANGQALFTPNMVSPGLPGNPTRIDGSIARSPEKVNRNADLNRNFNGPDQINQFHQAQTSLARLHEISHDLDNIAAGGTLQNLGPGATMGNQLADFTNKVSSLFGGKPVFDPNVSASAQDFKKQTANLVGNLTEGLGQHSQAALAQMQDAVPSLENTYLGSRVIMGGAKALLQREIDRREYINAWSQNPANQGAIDGAEEKFNLDKSPQSYIDKTFDHFGMDANGGFRDPSFIINDIHKGYLSPDQGQKLLKENFPDFKNTPTEQAAIMKRLKILQKNGVDDE